MQQSEDFLNPKIRNLMVTLSYDGSCYHGWQVQKNAVTVQDIFQTSLQKILEEIPEIKGCSRTDTGVHANMYAVSFKTNSKIKCKNLIYALNRFLPSSMAAYNCKEVAADFHARYSCKGKEYIYKIWNHKLRNPFLSGRALHYWYPLDIEKLNAAAQKFVGAHDFTAFATLDKRETRNMVRNIEYFSVYEAEPSLVEIKVKADGFLYNMVRIMVGTLLRVAQGKIKTDEISEIINSKCRKNAGPTAPAHGLYLNKVFY